MWLIIWMLFGDASFPVDVSRPADVWIFGSFTRAGAAQAVAASAGPHGWELWLMEPTVGGWRRTRKVATACSGELRSLHVAENAVDLVELRADCGRDLKTISLQHGVVSELY